MKSISFQELISHYNHYCEQNGVDDAARNLRVKHFSKFIAECNFKPTDKIERLVEKEIYLLENHKGTCNPRHVKQLLTKGLIRYLDIKKINTLPLLPTLIYNASTQVEPFKFGRNQKKAFNEFACSLGQIDLQLHKLIVLNIFYRIECKQIAREITTSSIQTRNRGKKQDIWIEKHSRVRIVNIPITQYARDLLLQDCDKGSPLCTKSLSPFMDKQSPTIIKEYGFKDTQEFKDTVFQKLVNLLTFDGANNAVGFSTPAYAREKFRQDLSEGKDFLLNQYFPIQKTGS